MSATDNEYSFSVAENEYGFSMANILICERKKLIKTEYERILWEMKVK